MRVKRLTNSGDVILFEFITFIKEYWSILSALIAFGFSVAMLLLAKTYAKREDVTALEYRVKLIESAIKSMPSQHDFHQLQIRLTEIHGDLKAIRPELRQLSRLHDAIVSVKGDK